MLRYHLTQFHRLVKLKLEREGGAVFDGVSRKQDFTAPEWDAARSFILLRAMQKYRAEGPERRSRYV